MSCDLDWSAVIWNLNMDALVVSFVRGLKKEKVFMFYFYFHKWYPTTSIINMSNGYQIKNNNKKVNKIW